VVLLYDEVHTTEKCKLVRERIRQQRESPVSLLLQAVGLCAKGVANIGYNSVLQARELAGIRKAMAALTNQSLFFWLHQINLLIGTFALQSITVITVIYPLGNLLASSFHTSQDMMWSCMRRRPP
jgi:hypothetical protein